MSLDLEINQQRIAANRESTLFEWAETVGIRVPTSCNKQGKCKECLVEVHEGMALLSPRTEQEEHLKEGFRLSCRTRIEAETGTIRCHTLKRGEVKIVHESLNLPVTGKPLELKPAITRDGNRILLDGEEIAQSSEPIHGLAVDLGTTTVAMRLVNLETGEIVAVTSFENPQRFGGSDVMARIKYDTDNKGRLLQRVLQGYMTHAIEALPVDPKTIYEMVIAGNATMREIFFGFNVESIGQRPYRSVVEEEMLAGKRETTELEKTALKSRMPIHPKARVYGLPLIGCHVGADTAACLLAIELDQEERIVALMDIGTNTELVVGNKDRILAASCPAGPAFEGGELSCGMPGVEGAIERVVLKDDRFECSVIGGGPAEGLCGSGLIDLLSELLREDRMNHLGRFEEDDDPLMIDEEHQVSLAENDISLLAQAKGANVAGLRIVMQAYGLDFDKLERFYLAGGFARHIDPVAARRIGLVPDLSDDRIVQVGNASLEGATIALCSVDRRAVLRKLVRTIDHVELETDPDFFDHFVQGCQFIPVESLHAN